MCDDDEYNPKFACAVMRTAAQQLASYRNANQRLQSELTMVKDQLARHVLDEIELKTELDHAKSNLNAEKLRRYVKVTSATTKKDNEISQLHEELDYATETINDLNDQLRLCKQRLERALDELMDFKKKSSNTTRSGHTDNDDWDYYDIVDETVDVIQEPMLRRTRRRALSPK
ncbi:putative nucleic acid-binding protein [Heliothis virescens ascovirus 3e]|uniref:Putative nucleic acid-binding protein n=1 Tax=Heliothis virescens ascovirus 3e TaxID=260797 RepID=A4KXB7_HVAVE|nr:putative nucleic acid-binding protein [Heliothis virescens ascovirus 3e]ABO37248.1 putative nucleic acid-binding protein [Heliothis virescens ascovirus 3e]